MFPYNHFFVDGSALLGDIKRLRQTGLMSATTKVCLVTMARRFTSGNRFADGGFVRFTYYFVNGDTRLERDVIIPNFSKPFGVDDLRIEYCGRRVKEVEVAQKWLEQNDAPPHVRDCLYRSEKALDTQLCADALQLAAVGKLSRLFLYTNDYDFVPLCRALRNLGMNVTLFRLKATNVNEDLAKECDSLIDLASAGPNWLHECIKD